MQTHFHSERHGQRNSIFMMVVINIVRVDDIVVTIGSVITATVLCS
jgi:hypothetical protein